MRVHELAKLYELNYKEVLEICKKSKVDVKDSPHASLTDDACRVIVPLIKSFKKSKEGNNAVTTEEKPSKKAAPVKAKKTEKKRGALRRYSDRLRGPQRAAPGCRRNE